MKVLESSRPRVNQIVHFEGRELIIGRVNNGLVILGTQGRDALVGARRRIA
jgi:hypothetical protein